MFMISFLKHASRKPGLWLAVGSVMFVVGWRLCVIASQPAHLLAIASEVGSIALPKEELNAQELVPSSEGHGLVFFQETETGLGTYFWDAAIGKSKYLFEQREKWYAGELGIVAWSPDDRFFACAFKSDPDPGKQQPTRNINIYDGNSGEAVMKITALWDSKFTWLSSHSFAYTRYNQTWLVYEQKTDGNWVQTQVVNRFGDGDLNNLTAIPPHSVAWQHGGDIWTYDFTSGASGKIWESTTNNLRSFNYSEETGNFLLDCNDENGPLSICFRPPRSWEKQGTILSMIRNDIREEYADLSEDHGRYSFTMETNANSEPLHFAWSGAVEYYKLAGDYLYFTGNLPDGPPGIWQYDIKSKEVQCLDSCLKGHFQYTKMVVPTVGLGTNASGEPMSYHVWAPIHVSPGKKYPLIIGQTHYMWFSYEQVAANAECFFAFADRPSWWDGLPHWGEDVMGLYTILSKNPNIDTNRVFLFATSAESSYLRQFVAEEPGFWKGVILFDPVGEPDLASANLSKMFIASGTDDTNVVQQLTKYQDEAAKAGIPVKLILQDGVQHITRSIATDRQRTRQFARFLIEN